MNRYIILCIDDEREVLDSVIADLESFSSQFDLEAAQSVTEAQAILADLETQNQKLALVLCDHIMPNDLGVDFLIKLNTEEHHKNARKILLTGQAGLEATIAAVNNGGLDYYIAKPWDENELNKIVKQQLTTYIIANEENALPYATLLDAQLIFTAISEKRLSI